MNVGLRLQNLLLCCSIFSFRIPLVLLLLGLLDWLVLSSLLLIAFSCILFLSFSYFVLHQGSLVGDERNVFYILVVVAFPVVLRYIWCSLLMTITNFSFLVHFKTSKQWIFSFLFLRINLPFITNIYCYITIYKKYPARMKKYV